MGRPLRAAGRCGCSRAAPAPTRASMLRPPAGRGAALLASLTGRVARELRRSGPTRDHPEPVRGGGRRGRAAARSFAGEGGRGGARRLAHLDEPLRLAAARLIGPLGDRLAGWAVDHADGHRAVSGSPPSMVRARGASRLAIFTTFSDLGAFTGPARAGPRGAARRVRRGARALQERREPRRGLAARRRAACRTPSCTWSARHAGRGGGGARARGRRVGPAPRAGGASRAALDGVPCARSCRRPRRGSRASRSRRSSAVARSSGRAPAASRTSSRTG